ncbi:MAG TPA: L,D-transpeptidase [Flavobacteriales bacterium]|nr:L,D-transpeptidase [Flavobacteriales bacterium]HQX37440.1 L,D-transpeptidase [Flavobacteriales bacterium]
MRSIALLAVALSVPVFAGSGSEPSVSSHPKQAYIDFLLEYMEVRYPDHPRTGTLLYVSLDQQRIFLVKEGMLLKVYPVATASNGPGMEVNSNRTPTGLHMIGKKIGDNVPKMGILSERLYTGQLADPDRIGDDIDLITSRILWLEGLEPGVNKGGDNDSYQRCIYIHGTANERSIGSPSSHGCVRMLNADVIELYESVPTGALVVILDN